jgi:hypothetical protein
VSPATTYRLILVAAAFAALYFTVAVVRRLTEQENPVTATVINSVQLSQTPTVDPTNVACDAVNGNITPNTGATCFRIQNSDTASHTVVFTSIVVEDSLALADLTVTVAASAVLWVSQLPVDIFGAQVSYLASNALVKVTAFEP